MPIKIISSNIRFDNPADGAHNWDRRKEILSNMINQHASTLLGTQEGREPQLRDLERRLAQLSIIDTNRAWISDRMYPTIYIDKNRFKVLNSGDIWLSETPTIPGSSSFESAFPRLCTWAAIENKKDSRKILVTNVHLDHVKSQTREKQIQVLINEISKIKTNYDFPLVLMGDFNEGPDENVRKTIKKSWGHLVDPWVGPEESSHHKFSGTNEEGKRIDWFLLDDKLEVENLIMDKGHENNIWPSDHFPIVLTIK